MNPPTGILASSYYVPDRKLAHDELCQRFGHETMDKVADSSGIRERRVAAPDQCASDLAYRAAVDLLDRHRIARESIDLLIFATQTPDYLLPTTACILQDRLGLPQTCAAFDINLGCSQYVYGLSVAHGMLHSGLCERALVLTGDTVSRILHPQDRAVVPLFGDAGTATLMGPVEAGSGFQCFEFGTDGSGHRHLIWPASGLRKPRAAVAPSPADEDRIPRDDEMFMDGAAIFVFTLKTVPRMMHQLLAKARLTVDDVDLFVFHQASRLIIDSSAKKLGIPPHKLHYKLHDVGNSGGSTVGITLTDAWLHDRIRPGMTVVLAAFGVGLSWAATVIRWPAEALGPVCTVDFSGSPECPGWGEAA